MNEENKKTSKDLEVLEASSTSTAQIKTSNLSKNAQVDDVDSLEKNVKSTAQAIEKGQTSITRNRKPSPSKNVSFPSKQSLHNVPKNIDVKVMKTDAKSSRVNISVVERSVYNRHLSSHESSEEANSSDRQSMTGKVVSVNDQNHKLIGRLIKDNEDNRSTTSTSAPREPHRRSGSGFTFRVSERAEKRKEFYSKLEEKTRARELERENLQAKSKKCQEVEIKQLRKSMTFVATPMPSFYREPPPPKVELKKLPTTRPISPKLGRHVKIAIAGSNASETSLVESLGRRAHQDPNKSEKTNIIKNTTVLRKPTLKSLTKLPSKRSNTNNSEAKPLNTKTETSEPENCNNKIFREESEKRNEATIKNPSETETRT